MLKRAVFLDRDGVINRTVFRDGKPRSPDRLEDFEFLAGVEVGVAQLRSAGYLIVVVTNQPDVARGWLKREIVEAMNDVVRTQLKVDDLKVCYHDDGDGCLCRKPLPGMLADAARDLGIDLARSFMVGDRKGDIDAGRAAGCRGSILVTLQAPSDFEPDACVNSLLEASEWILRFETENPL